MLMTRNSFPSPRSKNTQLSLRGSHYLNFSASQVSFLYKQEVFLRLYQHKLFPNTVGFATGLLDKSGKHDGRMLLNSESLDAGLSWTVFPGCAPAVALGVGSEISLPPPLCAL